MQLPEFNGGPHQACNQFAGNDMASVRGIRRATWPAESVA